MMKTDKEVQKDVIAELSFDPAVNQAEIGVEVKDGVVTLTGHVSNYSEKWNAETAAQRVAGVKALVIDMDTVLPELSVRSDADIAQSVENILRWKTFLPENAVKIMIENGWVKLSGEVEWEYQRLLTIEAIRHITGVTGVSDNIKLKPKIGSNAIKAIIEAALNRRTRDVSQNIQVAVQGSEVTLSGKVLNWSDRYLAIHSAWNTPGVSNVKDHIVFTN
ncbi:BON domain-containing protein [Methylosoma difficile]